MKKVVIALVFIISEVSASLLGEYAINGPTIKQDQSGIPDFGLSMQFGWEFHYNHEIRPQIKLFASVSEANSSQVGVLIGSRLQLSRSFSGIVSIGPGVVSVSHDKKYFYPNDTTKLLHPISDENDNTYRKNHSHLSEPTILGSSSIEFAINPGRRCVVYIDVGADAFAMLKANPNIHISPYTPYVTPFLGMTIKFTFGKYIREEI